MSQTDKPRRDHHYPRFELLIPEFLERVAEVMTTGAEKYGDYNWQKFTGDQVADIPRHAFRHIVSHMNNEYGEGAEDHLANAACNIMMAMWHQTHPPLVSTEVQLAHQPINYGDFTVYLAGPIDGAPKLSSSEFLVEWREELAHRLEKHGATTFNPLGAFIHVVGYRGSKYMESVNNTACMSADVVVAYFPTGITTVGTVNEVNMRLEAGLPVIVVSENEFKSFAGATHVKGLGGVVDEVVRLINNKAGK
jgi:hypothetical protein